VVLADGAWCGARIASLKFMTLSFSQPFNPMPAGQQLYFSEKQVLVLRPKPSVLSGSVFHLPPQDWSETTKSIIMPGVQRLHRASHAIMLESWKSS
jgi:hypothetical protein